jgi:hypothetical protein
MTSHDLQMALYGECGMTMNDYALHLTFLQAS